MSMLSLLFGIKTLSEAEAALAPLTRAIQSLGITSQSTGQFSSLEELDSAVAAAYGDNGTAKTRAVYPNSNDSIEGFYIYSQSDLYEAELNSIKDFLSAIRRFFVSDKNYPSYSTAYVSHVANKAKAMVEALNMTIQTPKNQQSDMESILTNASKAIEDFHNAFAISNPTTERNIKLAKLVGAVIGAALGFLLITAYVLPFSNTLFLTYLAGLVIPGFVGYHVGKLAAKACFFQYADLDKISPLANKAKTAANEFVSTLRHDSK